MATESYVDSLARAARVADQQCTAHGHLRDVYFLYARCLDLLILGVSTWLLAMTFVEPKIGMTLAPAGIESTIWIGLLSIGVFFLSLVQLLVNWKAKADNYQRSLMALSGFVKSTRPLVHLGASASQVDIENALATYQQISEWMEHVPEKLFLSLKQKHLCKVEISKTLDKFPSASIFWLKVTFWIRDNLQRNK